MKVLPILFITVISSVFLVLSACASNPHKRFDGVHRGMDKDHVLEELGNPNRTFRSDGKDHWIFVYYADEKEFRRIVSFDNGLVVRLSRPLTRDSYPQNLERATTMEEYEQKAREHSSRSSSQFRNVDSVEKSKKKKRKSP